MPVETVPQKFKSNGREFSTPADADRYEKMCDARQKLEDAQRVFQQVLAENCKTADGFQFEFGILRDYQYVMIPYGSIPYLKRVNFSCWSWRVREDGETVEIREDDGKPDDRYVSINRLFASEIKADAALLAARRKWMSERQAEVDAFAENIGAK